MTHPDTMNPGTTPGATSAAARVDAAFRRIEAVDRPEIWITLRPREEVMAEAEQIDAGPGGPLAGWLLGVKDNIDVAGLPTTAGCPAFAYSPEADAPAVARLRAAGAIVLGKTNLDQFATGLVGTRSPYGPVRDAARPERISGGSSSGSAVAVALGLVDLALGTDTAGSGRVPAAFQGLVGAKPTRGLISTVGVVPACRTLDCVTVFASSLAAAQAALWTMADDQPAWETGLRGWPAHAPLADRPVPRIAIPAPDHLGELSPGFRAAFAAAVARFRELGAEVQEIDLTPFRDAGALLYQGAFVAERYAAVGAFIDAHPEDTDPSVRQIISGAREITASTLVADTEVLEALRAAAFAQLGEADALLLPTVPRQPTLAEVARDPITVNAEMGAFTSFANLLDLCALAIPAGHADGGHFGVSLLAHGFADQTIADLAARFLDESLDPSIRPGGIPLLVVGAHRRGQPLSHQLTGRGARFTEVISTSPDYRMYALRTQPPKPGLLRVDAEGVSIEGELWTLPAAELGPFLAALPRPMALGQVTLSDGRSVVGFGVEPEAARGAPDISHHGSWLAYLSAIAEPSDTTEG